MEKKGFFYALLGGSLWGLSGTCGQFIFMNSSINAFLLTWIRMFIAGLFLTGMNLILDREPLLKILKNKKDCLRCLLFAFAGLLVCQLSYLETIQYSNSGTATVLQYSGILFILFVTCILEKRIPQVKEAIAVLLVLTGVFFVATHGQLTGLVVSNQALMWGMISSASMVLYSMLPGNLLLKYGASHVVGWSMCMIGIVLPIFSKPWEQSFHLSFSIGIALIGVVVLGTILGFSLYLSGVAKIGAMKASMISCVEPVVATVSSAFCLHTNFTTPDLMGFLLIILGVLLVNYRRVEMDR